MTSEQEIERVYSFNPGARTGFVKDGNNKHLLLWVV